MTATSIALPGHGTCCLRRSRPLARWRSLARIVLGTVS